jgi:hypothetical protein
VSFAGSRLVASRDPGARESLADRMCAAENRRIMLGELLLKAGVISEGQLRAALGEQKKWGGKLGMVLVDMGFLKEETLVKALSKQLGLPRVDFDGLRIAPEALQKIDRDYCETHQILPVSFDGLRKQLVIAMADPQNLKLVDEIGFRTGCKIHVAIAGERALAQAIRAFCFGEGTPEAPAATPKPAGVGGQPMKLINSQGDTLVRKLKDIKPPLEPKRPPKPTGAVDQETEEAQANSLKAVELLQRKQLRIMKALIELLVEKGYITHEDYRRKVEH